MSQLREKLSGLVYSTENGKHCPGCSLPVNECTCSEAEEVARLSSLDGTVRIRYETKHRKGKGVTIISGIAMRQEDLKTYAQRLKKRCGTGGAVKNGVIEIQGDHRQLLKSLLEIDGYDIKM